MAKGFILEKTTQAFIKELESKGGKPIYKLTPKEARAVLEKIQSQPIDKPMVSIEDKMISGGPKGKVSIRIVRPHGANEKLPVTMYFHGAGWVMGSASTHDRLVRELAVGSHSAVVFVNYSLSPEAQFPVPIEEAYAATQYIAKEGKNLNLDTSHIAVAGDSVGGNMTIAVTLLAKERHGPKFESQVLFYPVTSAEMNTPSYKQYAEGPWLTKPAMQWFWDSYEPNVNARKNPLVSPLLAPLDQLKGFPQTLVITDENDVLRDEGEQFASKLMQAGVNVTAMRVLGTTHDFAMLNALAHTPATRLAIATASKYLYESLHKQAKKGAKAA